MWKTLTGDEVDDLPRELLRRAAGSAEPVHIGTDAKARGQYTHFVTVIVMRVGQESGGWKVYYKKVRTRRSRSLAEQLFKEVELSVETATWVRELMLQKHLVVHVDANEDLRHKSSAYVKSLSGMVLGYGFDVQVKPDSWCASCVADFVVNEKNRRAA